ncbi:MAG: response regulator [Candidatus Scalindua sp.]
MPKISVLLAEDHHIVREGVSSLLSMEKDIDIIGEAKDGDEAVKMAKDLCPDVVIIDITMPVLNGITAVKQIKRYLPDTKVLILTIHTNEQYINEAFDAGVSGYILKETTCEYLVDAIRKVHKGGDVVLSPSIARFVVNTYVSQAHSEKEVDSLKLLTEREKQILRLIANGKTNKEIAGCLSISKCTVNSHRANIMQKIGIHDTVGLVKYSIEKGLIEINKQKEDF